MNEQINVQPTQPVQAVQQAQSNAAGQPDAAFAGEVPPQFISDIPDIPTVTPLKKSYTKAEAITALICLVMGFLFDHFVAGYAGGIYGGIFWALYGVLGALYLHFRGVKVSKWHAAVFAAAEVFCFVPLFSANGFINFLAAMFSFMLMFYIGISVSGAELFGKRFASDMLMSVFVRPFTAYGDCPRAAFSLFKREGAGKTVLYVLLGLVMAVPLTIVVVILLISSDGIFESVIGNMFKPLTDFSFLIIPELIFAFPVAMYLYGMLSAACTKTAPRAEGAPSYRFLPAAAAYTMVTPICVFYLIYIITQMNYFTAAFGGTLPEGYSYSEFARRGFFELCVVAVINLCVIMFIQAFVRRGEDDRRPAALRIYTVVISAFTLLLIASSMSKMLMYISEMGMTPLRIYTFWFMTVLAVAFALVIVWQIKELPFWRVMFAVFTVMMGVLCFGDLDGMIAKHNVDRYLDSGKTVHFDLDMYSDHDPAAVKHIARLAGSSEYVDRYLDRMQERLTHTDHVAYFSIPLIEAENALCEVGRPCSAAPAQEQ